MGRLGGIGRRGHCQKYWFEVLVFPHASTQSYRNFYFSNCNGSLILDVLRYARIEPQVLQVELHPYLSQEPLVKLVKLLGIAITAYSSFGPQVSNIISLHGLFFDISI